MCIHENRLKISTIILYIKHVYFKLFARAAIRNNGKYSETDRRGHGILQATSERVLKLDDQVRKLTYIIFGKQ